MTKTAAAPTDAPTVEPDDWSRALRMLDHTEMTGELVEAWACAFGVWGDYVRRLAASRTPLAVLEAGAHLMVDSADIWSRAAGARLRDGGVDAPLLNDA